MILLSAMTTFVLAGLGLGGILRKLIGLERQHGLRLELRLWELALGWSLLSMWFLVLGLAGWLTTGLVWGLLVLWAGLEIWALARSPQFRRLRPGIPRLQPMEWVGVGLTVLFTASFLLIDQAPPLGEGAGWDGLEYHLPTIQAYVRAARIVPIPDMVYSNYPMGFNILFAPGLVLGQLGFPGLLQFLMGLLSGLMMACLAYRHISRIAAFWMTPIFFAIPLVQEESTWPMVDLALTFYAVAAVAAMIRWQKTKHRPFLGLAGVMVGFSCSIKFTSTINLAALGVIALGLIWNGHPRRPKDWLAPLAAFGIPVLAFGSPWYVKTYALTGNPFLPYFYGVFGGQYWSPQANERYLSYLYNLGLQLPASIRAGFSLAVLSATGVILLRTKLQPAVKILGAFVSLWLVFFLYSGSPQQRFLLPVVPIGLLLLSWGLSALVGRAQDAEGIPEDGATPGPPPASWLGRLRQKHMAVPVYAIVGLVVLGSLLRMAAAKSESLAVGLGIEDPQAFLARRMYLYKADRFANETLPESAAVFLFPDCRSVYLRVPYVRGDPLMQVVVDYSRLTTAGDLLERLRELGVTHVMVSYPAYEYYRTFLEKDPDSVAYVEHAMELIEGLTDLGSETLFEANGVAVSALP